MLHSLKQLGKERLTPGAVVVVLVGSPSCRMDKRTNCGGAGLDRLNSRMVSLFGEEIWRDQLCIEDFFFFLFPFATRVKV